MAPLPSNNTTRWWVDYINCGTEHTLMARSNSTMAPTDAASLLAAFFAAHNAQIYETSIVGFRTALAGVDVSTPVAWTEATSYGTGVGPKYAGAWYYDYVGRGAAGKRVRAGLFGAILLQAGNDYRITPAEQGFVADALAALQADVDFFLDINLDNPVWKPYANSGVNAYWRNKLR